MNRMTGRIAVALALLGGVGVWIWRPWSGQAQSPRTQFAADRDPGPAVAFDGKRAMGYLVALCNLGPRISGTDGMRKQQELLRKHFESLGGRVHLQPFTARQSSQPRGVAMANLIVKWQPDLPRRVILCSHYDTRPLADQEPDERKWREPFVSANDGGSGVALLMELAHHMKDLQTNVGVDFVFFDGEEFVYNKSDVYFLGSRHFAEAARRDRNQHRYLGAILLDMVGGKNARFPVEPQSLTLAGALVEEVWKIAAEQKCGAFLQEIGTAVDDDHIALNRAGIPAIDIIDFSYRHWHRLTDVPANCSGESLEQVARVLIAWLKRVK